VSAVRNSSFRKRRFKRSFVASLLQRFPPSVVLARGRSAKHTCGRKERFQRITRKYKVETV
jgi:hypothetical protein